MNVERLAFDVCPSPVGTLIIVVSAHGLRALLWENERAGRMIVDVEPDHRPTDVSSEVARQLSEYFAKQRTTFDVPLDPRGTSFQKRAWQALREIPYGETMSYGEQARRIGDAGLARAVGAANGRNPIGIIVPCHRVLGADGSLTGFAGGLDTKRFLLTHEGAAAVRPACTPTIPTLF